MSALAKETVEYGYEQREWQESEIPRNKKGIKKKKKNKIILTGVTNVLMVGIAFVLGLSLVYNYSVITEKKMEIVTISEELSTLNNEIAKYNIALESFKNTEKVEEIAGSYLGMSYPTRKQTVFLDFTYEDTSDEKTVVEEDGVSKVLDFIDKLVQFIQ